MCRIAIAYPLPYFSVYRLYVPVGPPVSARRRLRRARRARLQETSAQSAEESEDEARTPEQPVVDDCVEPGDQLVGASALLRDPFPGAASRTLSCEPPAQLLWGTFALLASHEPGPHRPVSSRACCAASKLAACSPHLRQRPVSAAAQLSSRPPQAVQSVRSMPALQHRRRPVLCHLSRWKLPCHCPSLAMHKRRSSTATAL